MYRQAILTKMLPPTNRRGARIKALAQSGSIVIAYDHAKSARDNHKAAAKALATKLDCSGFWVAGMLPNGTSDVFVLVASYKPREDVSDIEIAFAVAPRA